MDELDFDCLSLLSDIWFLLTGMGSDGDHHGIYPQCSCITDNYDSVDAF